VQSRSIGKRHALGHPEDRGRTVRWASLAVSVSRVSTDAMRYAHTGPSSGHRLHIASRTLDGREGRAVPGHGLARPVTRTHQPSC
jgi:hypothetical protein